jgi:hypothetical protein
MALFGVAGFGEVIFIIRGKAGSGSVWLAAVGYSVVRSGKVWQGLVRSSCS